MTTAPHVPAPPQGPGVHPPFPAPPVEGKGRRIGLGLGIAGAVLLLVCGGGGAALLGLGTSMQAALQERAHVAVQGYLGALQAKNYQKAYDLLCDDAQDEESLDEFRSRVTGEDPIESWTLGRLDLTQVAVPVDARYSDGRTAQLEAYLGQDTTTGAFEVCELSE